MTNPAGPRSTKVRLGPNVIGVHLTDTVTPSKGTTLQGDVAHDKLMELQKALLCLEFFGAMDSLELRRLVQALQRIYASSRMSPDEIRRVSMDIEHLVISCFGAVGVAVEASSANTNAEAVVGNDKGGSPETRDDRTVSDEGHGGAADRDLMPSGTDVRTVECVKVHAEDGPKDDEGRGGD
ncbi:hypothetical protein HPB52_000300 [Rhipicephalus sanguineus]|uniref:Uncharacterized protein n=1 Tax=Rhipicephalus sanguineus TaxID=34632 RepID=A0A9D4PFS8_RHISA|nr:hypothetical protein HPB52_000300 [Rhipicephalus sanguineus]